MQHLPASNQSRPPVDEHACGNPPDGFQWASALRLGPIPAWPSGCVSQAQPPDSVVVKTQLAIVSMLVQ